MLLFEAIEVRNGARAARYNRFTEAIVRIADAATSSSEMAEQARHRAGRRRAVAQGDRRRLRRPQRPVRASAHTVAECDGTIAGFLAAIRDRRTDAGRRDGDSLTLAHSIYAVTQPPECFAPRRRRRRKVKRAASGAAPRERARRSSTPFLLHAVQKYFDPDGQAHRRRQGAPGRPAGSRPSRGAATRALRGGAGARSLADAQGP